MPLTPNSPEPLITEFQHNLQVLNYNIGKSGADGKFGRGTKGGACDFCEDHNLPNPKGMVIEDNVLNMVEALANAKRNLVIKKPAKFLDLTRVAEPTWRRYTAKWTDIPGGVLHNTGCPLTDITQAEVDYFLEHDAISLKHTPGLMRWAKHHVETLKDGTKVYQALKCHYGITYSGWILNIHPINVFGWHAHALSKGIGYECAGLMLGVEDDPTTARDEEDAKTRPSAPKSWEIQSATEAQIESLSDLIDYDVAIVNQHGGRYEYIDPHRVGAPEHSRRGDCGSKLVKRVILPAIKRNKLKERPVGYTAGKSIDPMPEVWDERCKGIKY